VDAATGLQRGFVATVAATPEPGTLGLLRCGLVAVMAAGGSLRRRSTSQKESCCA
jgi:hypothetical protein